MADITYDEVAKLAEQLSSSEQLKLIYHLRMKQATQYAQVSLQSPTREELIQELGALRATGAFDSVESLYGKYANPSAPDLSEEEFHAELHKIATEWEQELDEFDTSRD